MRMVVRWMLVAGQPEVFSASFMVSARLCGPFLYTLVARVCAFFTPFRNILIVVVSLSNLHLLASHLNQ